MNKEKIQKQLSEIATAANSLATALTTLSIDVCTDIPGFTEKQSATETLLAKFFHANMLRYAPGRKCAKCKMDIKAYAVQIGEDIYCVDCANLMEKEGLQQALDNYKGECHHHCGQDAVNEEQLPDNLTDAYKDYCRGVLEQFLSREITWAKFVEKVALPFCHENINEFVNAIKEGRSDCGQDATCQVGDGSAVVDKPIITGESLEKLVGATVRLFHKPGHKCIDCPYRSKSYGGKCEYKKVELVGGFYLCLAPLPNSIVTE